MPTRSQLESALRNADAAGDVAAAKQLANALKSYREQGASDFSWEQTAKNIPKSAGKMVGDMYQAVTHPVQLAKGMGGLALGAANKMSTATDFGASPMSAAIAAVTAPYRPYADAAIEGVKGRYGSWDAAKQTLMNDPVGVLADTAGVVSGVGAVTRAPSLVKAGAAMNPINIAANTVKAGASAVVPKRLPAKLYGSAAKFSTTLPEAKRTAMVDTALKNRIPPTARGVALLEGKIADYNQQIDGLIKTAQEAGKSVPKSAVYRHLKDLRQQKGGVRLDASDDLAAINATVKKFEKHLDGMGKDSLTPTDLQKLKVSSYEAINWDAKRMTGAPIKEDTYKAIARGAKESLEELSPNIGPTNQQLGKLYELQPHLQRAANRIDNHNIISLDSSVKTAAGAGVGDVPGAGVGALLSILGNPKAKAETAIRLQALKDQGGLLGYLRNNPTISNAELAAILGGRSVGDHNSSRNTNRR